MNDDQGGLLGRLTALALLGALGYGLSLILGGGVDSAPSQSRAVDSAAHGKEPTPRLVKPTPKLPNNPQT